MRRTALFLAIAIFASAFASAEAKPKSTLLPIALNVVPGYGIGSFSQGDALGGLVCLCGEGLGGSMAVGSLFAALFGARNMRPWMMAGAGLYCGTKLFAVVRPICFARGYSKKHGLATLGIAPSLSACGGGSPSPGLVLKLSY